MISNNSARVFIVLNGTLFTISYAYYMLSQTNFLLLTLFTFFRNVAMTNLIEYSNNDKQLINKNYIYPEDDFILYAMQGALFECATTYCIKPLNSSPNTLFIIAAFIPMSFAFEIIFDLFFYLSHRILHSVHLSWHKAHHAHIHLKPALAFYHNWVDVLLTISLPFILTEKIVQTFYPLSLFEISLLTTYKVFIEISGHSGRVSQPASSFSQFFWLPRFFHIELYTEDHNLHHTDPGFNFAKRFAFWDKVFGTYKSGVEQRLLEAK